MPSKPVIDTQTYLEDGAAPKVASGVGQIAGEDHSQAIGRGALAPGTFVRCHVTSIVTGGGETYALRLVGTNDGYTTSQVLCEIPISRTGIWDLYFHNHQAGVAYDECRIEHVLTGAGANLQYRSYLTFLP